jgi:hypothetical protein
MTMVDSVNGLQCLFGEWELPSTCRTMGRSEKGDLGESSGGERKERSELGEAAATNQLQIWPFHCSRKD